MEKRKKLCLACSVGGHLTQMLQLKELYTRYDYFFITEETPLTSGMKDNGRIYYVRLINRRMRAFLLILIANTVRSLKILWRERPDCIISTGALSAVPICYIGKLMGKKIIFIESYAKIHKPTLSGKLVHPIADLFIVQWKSLEAHYSKAVYGGSLY